MTVQNSQPNDSADTPVYTYADEVQFAAEQLNDSNLFASSDAEGALADYQGSEIAVVELPASAADSWASSLQDTAQAIKDRTTEDYKIVVTYVSDSSTFGLAADNTEMSIAAYEVLMGSEEGTIEEALFTEYGELMETTSVSPASYETGAAPDVGPALAGVGGSILGVAALVGAVVGTTKLVRYRKANPRPVKVVESKVPMLTPDGVDQFARFRKLMKEHRELGHTETSTRMATILSDLEEFVDRLVRSGDQQKKRLVEVEYAAILGRLNGVLGQGYYMEISRNSRFWNNAKSRRQEVYKALDVTSDLIVHNIRQYNDQTDLDFQTGLSTILSQANLVGNDASALIKPEPKTQTRGFLGLRNR